MAYAKNNASYADKLLEHQGKRGMSQGQFAALLRIEQSQLSNYMCSVRAPDRSVRYKISTILNDPSMEER